MTQWFAAAWHVCATTTGASALGLQKLLGLGSYHTAWAWLHKLRRAMVVTGRDVLHGDVEVDETFVGGEEPGLRGGRARASKKALVVIGVECRGSGSGRVRLARIPDASQPTLHGFITANVEPELILTDGWRSYLSLERAGYRHKAVSLRASTESASELLPRVHRVAALLKRWLLATHKGAVHPEHLDYYLDEFTFRFSRRDSRARGLLFYRLLHQAVRTPPHPNATLSRLHGQRSTSRRTGHRRHHKI